jgi:hypothetical protein
MSSVVQPWLAEHCTFKMQTVLLTSFRGCDGVHKDDRGKVFTRMMRSTVLKNADPTTSFFPESVDGLQAYRTQIEDFFDDMDHYPVHWFMHLLHAAEICGYKHPDETLSKFWKRFYLRGAHELHLGIETCQQMNDRLRDNR